MLVVDNGSEAAAVAQIRDVADVLLESGRNLGFGPGANVGLRWWLEHTESAWCAVMPHDALPAEGVLQRLHHEADARQGAGLVCADVGDQASPAIDPYLGPYPGPSEVRDGWETVAYPHGTLFLIGRSFATEVGLFDERYFAYNEEAELGLRARKAGWDVGLIRGAMVDNPGQGNITGIVDYLMLRNTIVMVREHFGLWHGLVRTCIAVVQLGLGLVRRRRRAPWFNTRARVLALCHAWTGRMGPPPVELTG